MNALETIYRECTAAGFGHLGEEAGHSHGGFTLAREDGMALCLLQVVDNDKLEPDVRKFLRAKEMERASSLSYMFSSIWVVFLSCGKGGSDSLKEAEAFFGQSPYAIYWHIDLDTQMLITDPNQPTDIMNLHKAVLGALEVIKVSPSPFVPDAPKPTIDETSEESVFPTKFTSSVPICTIVIAITNILMKILMYLDGYEQHPQVTAIRFGAIFPYLIWNHGEYFRLFTAMFLHFGWTHLFFNLTGLLIFGTRIEAYYGKFSFIFIYLFSGLSASAASLFLTQGISAGASGAIYGIIGAAFIYTRLNKQSMDVISNQVVIIYVVMGLGMSFVVPNIDYFAHIGGLIAGTLAGWLVLKLKQLKNKT
ncbi:MAG: rhomboid family intramembrane serine protease [Turicibacter sp.]|nr:rhomboid family intramembrane serine protease [Turicibacter sp.]